MTLPEAQETLTRLRQQTTVAINMVLFSELHDGPFRYDFREPRRTRTTFRVGDFIITDTKPDCQSGSCCGKPA